MILTYAKMLPEGQGWHTEFQGIPEFKLLIV